MRNPYHEACLRLIRGISKALEQMEERNYGLAEKTLRDAWDKCIDPQPADIPEDAPQRFVLR